MAATLDGTVRSGGLQVVSANGDSDAVVPQISWFTVSIGTTVMSTQAGTVNVVS